MEATPEEKKSVREALFSGEQSVQFRDRRVQYRTVEELKQIVALGQGVPIQQRRHRAIFDKGV